ncbi:MAG: serpin family protein [Clostridia bacterium]|nr:serpin family protein [Clostridia bacterium]
MKRTVCLFLIFVLVLCSSACGIKASDLTKDIKPMPTPNYIGIDNEMEKKQMSFSLKLFKNCAEAEKGNNLLISPVSVYMALAMTLNGADKDTEREMSALLGADRKDINPYIKNYISSLTSNDDSKFHLANSIWFRSDKNRLKVEESFLQTNADYFGAQVYETEFDERAKKDINNWVKKNTDGMIDKIVDEINSDTVMYLINALAFDAKWQKEYEKSHVDTYTFNSYSGERNIVDMMYSSEGVYLESGKAKGFKKYYKNGDYSFLAILPNEENDIYEFVSNGGIEEILSVEQKKGCIVAAGLPKFSYEYDISMKAVLSKMGMPSAFDSGKADFRKMAISSVGNIYISDVVHKTFIEVGEKGTKAGAVTKVAMNDEAAMVIEGKSVILDRPFIYMIVDNKSNLPLFIGLVADI